MAESTIIWADAIPDHIKSWVIEFFSAADGKGEEATQKFADSFSENGTMKGLTGSIHGRKGKGPTKTAAAQTASWTDKAVFSDSCLSLKCLGQHESPKAHHIQGLQLGRRQS